MNLDTINNSKDYFYQRKFEKVLSFFDFEKNELSHSKNQKVSILLFSHYFSNELGLITKLIKKIFLYFFQRIYFFFLLFTIQSLKKSDDRLIVSLTSQPSRIKNCWITILSILNQDFQNYKIILVLSSLEVSPQNLPWTLGILQKKGLEILWIKENLKSYQKLIPTRIKFPLSRIVTFDDDVVYEKWRLKILYEESIKTPTAIIGYRGKKLKRSQNKVIYNYLSWDEEATTKTFSKDTFLTGVGGILYPPNKEFDSLVTDFKLAKELAPTADDIFFWGVSYHLKIKRISLGFHFIEDIIELRKSPRLCDKNNSQFKNKNDLALKKVTSYFDI